MDPQLVSPANPGKTDTAKINSVMAALSSFSVEDVADPEKVAAPAALEKRTRLDYYLFDGTVYHIYPGNVAEAEDDTHFVSLRVSFNPPEASPSADSSTESNAESAKEVSAKAAALNKKISPWTYVISKWKYEDLITDLSKVGIRYSNNQIWR